MQVTDWSVYPNFKQSEFTCKCGCGTNRMSKLVMDMLQNARTTAGIPFVINSACRCPTHNLKVSKSNSGDHITDSNNLCFGVDIASINSRNRFLILQALILAGFDRIGVDDRFIHAGIGKSLGGRMDDKVVWFY
ncbi:MAG: D-Ala-D-Ala carboxypeptidase family metallohydrolase [Candidatus Cloacimonetes bacterium]|nr:D-Ala-D-Ala carboxypeptidase family metallohydrolase [Candidatus Cloacimonadota bacterium]